MSLYRQWNSGDIAVEIKDIINQSYNLFIIGKEYDNCTQDKHFKIIQIGAGFDRIVAVTLVTAALWCSALVDLPFLLFGIHESVSASNPTSLQQHNNSVSYFVSSISATTLHNF